MPKDVLYHNPRCRKSRETLELLQSRGVNVTIVEYLKTPPSIQDLDFICTQLKVNPPEIIRIKEGIFKELGLSVKDQRPVQEWLKILHDHPVLIERPILVYNNKVALGRPPENVLKII